MCFRHPRQKRKTIFLLFFGVLFLVSACVPGEYGYSPYGYGYGDELSYYMEGLEEVILGIRIIFALVGLALLLAGFAIYEALVKLIGFLVGGVIGAGITVLLGGGDDEAILALVGFLIGGGLGAALALLLTYLSIFLSGLWIGAAVIIGIWVGAFDRFPSEGLIIFGAVLGGIAMVLLFKFWIMALTSAQGAVLFGIAIGVNAGWWFVFFLAGLGVQMGAIKYLGLESNTGLSLPESLPFKTKRTKKPGVDSPPDSKPDKKEKRSKPSPMRVILPNNTQVPLRDKLIIGRSSRCDVQIPDKTVSRQHLLIRYAQGKWYFQDQNSTGGTYLNGDMVTAGQCQPGNHLKIGQTILIFQ